MEERGVGQLVELLLEDRRVREAEAQRKEDELRQERQLREREQEEAAARREREQEEASARRDEENDRRVRMMQEQLDMMREWMERSGAREDERVKKAGKLEQLKLTKLTDSEDIEAYLTTFERMMGVYEITEDKWAFRLAPQLTGKAQQAYAALGVADSHIYARVKEAVLRRYDINDETYRQRFRSTRRKEGEAYMELAIRLQDLLNKWTADCRTVEEVKEKFVVEQLLNTMPSDLRIWVSERKPTSGNDAGKWADDYIQARQREGDGKGSGGSHPRGDTRKCSSCGQVGHLAHRCWNPKGTQGAGMRDEVKKERVEVKKEKAEGKRERPERRSWVRCFVCNKVGHMSFECPDRVLFCRGDLGREVTRPGVVEGKRVSDIVLDTGCSRTMVRKELVDEEKNLEGRAVTVRCAHGDTVLYPLAQVELKLDGVAVQVEVAVSDSLPVSVLLGTDVPELGELLHSSANTVHSALVVTRAQARRDEEEEEARVRRDEESGVVPNTPEEAKQETPGSKAGEEEVPGSIFAEDLFQGGSSTKVSMTRSQKREQRHEHGLERAKDKPRRGETADPVLGITSGELMELQERDESLAKARELAEGKSAEVAEGYFKRDGLLVRRWAPLKEEDMPVDQVVLPRECRSTVLHLAHTIPLAGHLGKKKTAKRIMGRFYWPTVFRDVADYCRSCPECQKSTHRRVARAPLIPLPVIGEPFERMAMDIVGPLPRSRSGNRYVLVVCDYATRYPEAVPLRTIDAEHVADEIVKIFARVGIPKEILTDQGSNFTSKFLAEVYRLNAIRTSPYHPQTDGLVERFNQTLKEMLRKVATEEGKDWDKLLPYVLFAYREVPQEATGFSPFELVYGREVRGPLDVLRESWEVRESSGENVVSHLLRMRGRLLHWSRPIWPRHRHPRSDGTTGLLEIVSSVQGSRFWCCCPHPHQRCWRSGKALLK